MSETVAMEECKMSPASDALEFLQHHSYNPQPGQIQSEDDSVKNCIIQSCQLFFSHLHVNLLDWSE